MVSAMLVRQKCLNIPILILTIHIIRIIHITLSYS